MPEHEKKDRRRGPIKKADKLEIPEEKAGSAGVESTGAGEESEQPKSTPPTDTEPQSAPETSPSLSQATSDDDETPAMRQLREQHEAKAEGEGDKGPHPYRAQINNAAVVPFALRDLNGNPSPDLIEEHLRYCWNIGATPVIEGVMIGERVK